MTGANVVDDLRQLGARGVALPFREQEAGAREVRMVMRDDLQPAIGRGRAYLWLNNYAQAKAAVQGVATTYAWLMSFSQSSGFDNGTWSINNNQKRYTVGDSIDPVRLLADAELAVDRAKELGRNRIQRVDGYSGALRVEPRSPST